MQKISLLRVQMAVSGFEGSLDFQNVDGLAR